MPRSPTASSNLDGMDAEIPNRFVELELSPDHTWLTAPSPEVAWFVREAISAAGGTYGYARQGGRVVEEIINLGGGEKCAGRVRGAR